MSEETNDRARIMGIVDALRTGPPEEDDDDTHVADADSDAALLHQMAPLPAEAEAGAAADDVAMTPPIPLTLERRQRLLEQVDHELAKRRVNLGMIQVIVQRRRRAMKWSVEDAAARAAELIESTESVHVTGVMIADLEEGRLSLRETPALSLVAALAVVTEVPRDAAAAGLTASLRASQSEPFLSAASGSPGRSLSDADRSVVAAFLDSYDGAQSRGRHETPRNDGEV